MASRQLVGAAGTWVVEAEAVCGESSRCQALCAALYVHYFLKPVAATSEAVACECCL